MKFGMQFRLQEAIKPLYLIILWTKPIRQLCEIVGATSVDVT
jgi:hypothetical protein